VIHMPTDELVGDILEDVTVCTFLSTTKVVG
jgi:hypothetical protein